MSNAPSRAAAQTTTALRVAMGVLFVYGVAKAIILSLNASIPFLSTPSDPVFGIVLLLIGVLWTRLSLLYRRESKRSEARSTLYSEAFDHPDDAFEDGKQTSKQHRRRATLMGGMGVVLMLLASLYLLTTVFPALV
jgi:hypothetical protein